MHNDDIWSGTNPPQQTANLAGFCGEYESFLEFLVLGGLKLDKHTVDGCGGLQHQAVQNTETTEHRKLIPVHLGLGNTRDCPKHKLLYFAGTNWDLSKV
jgi:hypothetical protein